ncbi:MAG: putative sensor domain DACNV-containing protein [Sphingobacteriales bacterium]
MNNDTRPMLHEPTYKAARLVSGAVEKHFAGQLAAAALRGDTNLAPEPSKQTIAAIIDTAFWTSLRKEEGRSPKISLAFLPPDKSELPLIFEQRLALSADVLTKLAPAVERSGIHLGVWQDEDEIYIWGTTHTIPGFCFVLEVVEPGLLVVKHRRVDGFGKYVNVAVLKGDEVKVVDEQSINLPDCPALIPSLLGFTTQTSLNNPVNLHMQLAVSMRAHGHGGMLLVVPSDSDKWRESIIDPISYAVSPAFSGLSDLMNKDLKKQNLDVWREELKDEIDCVAGLTAVDGATIINDRHELLAFGAKITRPYGGETVREIMVTEPIIDSEAQIIAPGQDGGTRHFAAAQFVYDQRDAFALVASQDGRFTIFSWSPCDDIVHAHRVDTLLL